MPLAAQDYVTDSLPLGTVLAAVDYARRMGAHVINLSLGTPTYTQSLKNVIDAAAGSIVVCAAGNDGRDNESTPFYPASYSSANIIAVAASTQDDGLASFSNYGGTAVDVAAPGTNILSTWPFQTGYAYLGGTSMAAPIVSGLAALLLTRNGGLTPAQAIGIIKGSVDRLPSLAGYVASGGRINANRALQQALTPGSAGGGEDGGDGGGGDSGCFLSAAAAPAHGVIAGMRAGIDAVLTALGKWPRR
jgi:subtilisin family serine protease